MGVESSRVECGSGGTAWRMRGSIVATVLSPPALGFHPGYSIRDCCYITKREREREGGEYISIKDSSLSFSPPFLDFQSIFLVSLDWATSRSKNIIRKREGGGRSITTAHVFFGLFGLSYVCVALFCIKYMSQRDGNRKKPQRKQIKNRLWRPTTYPPPPTKILLCLFFFGVCYIPPSKGKRKKKKDFFLAGWLLLLLWHSFSLLCKCERK